MKNLFTISFLLMTLGLAAQPYNNEWIDFSKTYYKFKVGATGLYRIPQSALANTGLGSVPASNFQLFRNGVEVPVYTSNNGVLGAGDYIEFWGQMNDGVPDKPLYRSPAYQHTTHWSLQTDTAVYFLTVNPTAVTFHYTNEGNDPSATSLAPQPYFMYTAGSYFKSAINPGFAQVIGEYIYSSSYDIGEFWATDPSNQMYPGHPFSDSKNNLFVYNGGPDGSIRFGMAGCADNARTVQLALNGTILADTTMNSFNDLLTTRPVPVSLISGNTSTVNFINNSPTSTDRMVGSFYELTYPRQFNFGGAASFTFQLPAKSDGYLLNITGVAIASGVKPVLYDMTNGLRYTAVQSGSTLSFVLAGSTVGMNLVLTNEAPAGILTVNSLTPKNFVNYAVTSNQGNYIIISNPLLYTGSSGNNPIMDYKSYRSSPAGGSWNAQVYDINELVDQFAFGIKKHPLSIQNFLRYARSNFAGKPQYVFLIGHSMTYDVYNFYSDTYHDPLDDVLNMVPTFGNPASDNKLSANNGVDATPITPIGRLSVTSGTEVEDYLAKIKEYEQAQQTSPNTIDGRLWMKSVVHLTGVSEPYLGKILCDYMNSYGQIIADTLYGASINTFCDGNASQVSQVPANIISALFNTGFGMLCYFGHSSNTTLGYNLDNPQDYNNQGKYAVFFANGCDAGDFFIYDAARPSGSSKTLSESYVLAKERGSIAFVASTHFGVVNYLNILLYGLYNLMDGADYGKSLGQLQKDALNNLVNSAPGDYYARLHAEEMTTHGDPALKLNQLPTDYDIEASQVVINPAFISVSNASFDLKARFYNLGKAISDSVLVQVQRTYPNGTTAMIYSKKIRGIRYSDSIDIAVPIVGTRDKGENKITVSIDPGHTTPEVTYINNSVTTSVYIYQDEATPVYPYDYSIINTPTTKLIASTANPIGTSQQFIMQIDTTQNFNSPLMVSKTLLSSGGELEFDPGISYRDSVVYYWRVGVAAAAGGQTTWNNASFIYIDPAHSTVGSNQSHYFQHMGSTLDSMALASNRQWSFTNTTHNVYLKNMMYGYLNGTDDDFSTAIDGNEYMASACVGQSLVFNVIDPVTFKAWINVDANGNNLYLSGSGSANCDVDRNWNFEFSYMTPQSRYLMMRFMDSIPNGFIVVVHSYDFDANPPYNSYSKTWAADTSLHGHNLSLYNYLLNAGFARIDSINQPRAWDFIYKKNDASFTPQYSWTPTLYDRTSVSANVIGPNYTGIINSPQFGPAKKWGNVHWRGHSLSSPVTDTVGVQVIGVDTLGNSTNLYSLNRATQDLDISAVNPKQYPYIKLKLTTTDTVHAKPYQLDYWRLNYTPVAEGALAPNIVLKAPDSVGLGQPYEFEIAFKNISPYNFDSLKIKLYVLDRSNVMHTIVLPRRKPLVSGDTVTLDYVFDTKPYVGANTLYVDFNPDNDQPEQYLFNNFVYKAFYVKGDNRNPNLDVTFDNVHILNDDIVSSKPHIQIKLTSQSQYVLLTDTSTIRVQVKFPDGSMRNYGFNTDTVRFTPASSANNNVATVDFTPSFVKQYNPDGDEYQLIVSGKDELGNSAGSTPYRIGFKVITKAMISNMLNYPNPFTTSTAFVFTITGSDVPQNIKIQILTITGKIVREITKEELGPLHVGRNITEFKWNGTDMYGARLANGVYLYHVVTNLNGKSLDKYTAAGDNTSKFFNNGYGKMYLMGH
jgi:hypothetical protein